jgi:hypothetical protein
VLTACCNHPSHITITPQHATATIAHPPTRRPAIAILMQLHSPTAWHSILHTPHSPSHPHPTPPPPQIMRKLSGAKEKLGLRVHGLVIAAPDKKRADPAVLRALCTNYLPNGKLELLVSEFNNWASVQVGARAVAACALSPAVPAMHAGSALPAKTGACLRVCAVNAVAHLLARCCAFAAPRRLYIMPSIHLCIQADSLMPRDHPSIHPTLPNSPAAPLQADSSFALDWDDVEGNSKRRLAGLKLEAQRAAESRRLKQQMKARGETPAGMGKPKGKKH